MRNNEVLVSGICQLMYKPLNLGNDTFPLGIYASVFFVDYHQLGTNGWVTCAHKACNVHTYVSMQSMYVLSYVCGFRGSGAMMYSMEKAL